MGTEKEFKGTPGPCLLSESNQWVVRNTGGDVCKISNHYGCDDIRGSDLANAKLVAAAPDLLYALYACQAALRDIIRQLPTDERLADYELDFAEHADFKADAAINKALGND